MTEAGCSANPTSSGACATPSRRPPAIANAPSAMSAAIHGEPIDALPGAIRAAMLALLDEAAPVI